MIAPRIIVKKEFLLIKVLLATIYIALELYYNFFISTDFAYMGYIPDLNLFKYILTKLVFLSLLVLSYSIYKRDKFLYSIYSLLIFLFYLPVAILFSFSDFSIAPFVSTIFFISFFALTPYIKFPVPDWTVGDKFKPAILLGLSVLLLIPIVMVFGVNINLKTLGLSDIYETRESFSKQLNGWRAYLYNLEAKTIIPAALTFFLIRKRYFFTAALIGMLLYLYVISGNKLVYFTSIIVVFFYYVGKDHVSKLSNFFLLILICFAAFPILDNLVLNKDTPLLSGLFVNRFLFIPALLTNFYFDFFDGNPLYFAETHFFNLLVKSPYDTEVAFLISKVYWNGSDAYMNNGIVSDGFMNLGYMGVIIFSLMFVLLFAIFNSFRLHKGYFGLFFAYLFLQLSIPFLTNLITGGILVFILLSFFILRDDSQNNFSPVKVRIKNTL